MKLPRRRSSRPRGRARLALTGDFPADGRDITEAMEAIPPAAWHGTTIPLAALPGLPRYMPGGITPHLPAMPPPPPRTHRAAGRGWAMTVDTAAPPIPMDTRLRRARDFIELEVADLAAQGMLYRIDDAEQARQRGEDPDARSVIAVTVAKAARHLMGHREPWDPR